MSVEQLLVLQSSIVDELLKRKVARTKNNPLGDYTEWLVSKVLKLKLADNSSAGFDGIDKKGNKIQVNYSHLKEGVFFSRTGNLSIF